MLIYLFYCVVRSETEISSSPFLIADGNVELPSVVQETTNNQLVSLSTTTEHSNVSGAVKNAKMLYFTVFYSCSVRSFSRRTLSELLL